MTREDLETGGWIVTAERANGRSAKRHYLVAADDSDTALSAAQKWLGKEFRVAIGGPAAAIHFTRRNIRYGEAFELDSRSTSSNAKA